MKLIKKLKLINWHTFDNQEFEFSNINVITGGNGTGKSTILDAIHYLQSGGSCKFNSAANSQGSGRTVENYLKARIGGEDVEFLRNATSIIGHIAIEYFDELTRKPFVLGVVLQLVDNRLMDPIFYQIKGDTFNDKLFFTDENEVRNYDELEKEANVQELNFSIIGQKRMAKSSRQRNVLSALGVPNKYEQLFSKAISFEPLQNINNFATDFLLPEEDLDLTSIRDTMDAYRGIQEQIKIEETRRKELEPIVECQESYEESLRKELALNYLELKAKIDIELEIISNNNRSLKILDDEIEIAKANAKNKTEYALNLRRQADDIKNSDSYRQVNTLLNAREVAIRDYEASQNDIETWELALRSESNFAKGVGTSFDAERLISLKDYSEYQTVLSNYKDRLDKIFDSARKELIEKQRDFETLSNQKLELLEEVNKLRENNYALPQYVDQLKKDVIDEIKLKNPSTEVKVHTLNTMIELVDEEWRFAIEGYLANKRFDLFIAPAFYKQAKKVFDSKPDWGNYFSVGVIDSNSFNIDEKSITLVENSLANKISTTRLNKKTGKIEELTEVRNYINYLLGDIACVASVNEFIENKKAITKDGAYYDGKSVRYIDDKASEKPFIGLESIKKRLLKSENDLKICSKELNEIQNEKVRLELLCKNSNGSRIVSLLEEANHWNAFNAAKGKLDEINRQLDQLKTANQDILQQTKMIESLEKQAIDYEEECAEENAKVDGLNIKKGKLNSENEHSTNEVYRLRERTVKLDEDNENARDGLNSCISQLRGEKKSKKLLDFVNAEKIKNDNLKRNCERRITNAINLYCQNHPGEYVNDLSNYKQYIQRYNKIVNDDLAHLEPQLNDAYRRSIAEFEEHFISKIRVNLENAKSDIDNLNRALKKHPFGSDEELFEFVGLKKNDYLLGGIYHIAMETNQDYVTNNLFAQELDEKSKEVMEKAFDILSKNEDDADFKKERAELTDYRNYLNYDIRIKLNHGKNVLLYSKNSDTKSGGETQTPFYAMIAGAFQSILSKPERDSRSPVCLVCFDEAFNNMDGERIEQMLEFYRELKIQLIISVPSNRLSNIAPYSDLTISLAKADDVVAVYHSKR